MSLDNIVNPSSPPPPSPPPDQAPPPVVLPGLPPAARAVASPDTVHPPAMVRVRQNNTIEEKLNFLRIIEEVLPIGPDEWEQVKTLHSTNYPGRTSVSIRCKYHDLHRVKVLTGDPDCLDDVRMTKCIKYTIGDRVEVGSGEETYDLEVGVFEVEGGLTVGSSGNAHIADIGGAWIARGIERIWMRIRFPPAV